MQNQTNCLQDQSLQKIKAKTLTKCPSQVYDEVFEEAGGMVAFEALADIPEGRLF